MLVNNLGKKNTDGKGHKAMPLRRSVAIQCYLLLALPIIGFFVFTIYPMTWAGLKAFYFYDKNPLNTHFVGTENFINVFADESYWRAWFVTFKTMLIKLPVEIPLALIIAIMLRNVSKNSGMIYRAIFTLPNIVGYAIVGVIFSNIFDYFGCLNAFLQNIGISKEPFNWFANETGSIIAVCISGVWTCIGINILYFTAALTNVSDDVYEAAEIDGANMFVKFFKITIPMISPVFRTILLLAINGTMHGGENVITFTGGAPGGRTHTVGSYMIQTFLPGFATGAPNIGYGCAMALVTSLMSILIALSYQRMTKSMKEVY